MIQVPKPLIQAILTYLWSRPLSEAYDLFNQLSALVEESQEQPPEKSTQDPAGTLLHRDQIGR